MSITSSYIQGQHPWASAPLGAMVEGGELPLHPLLAAGGSGRGLQLGEGLAESSKGLRGGCPGQGHAPTSAKAAAGKGAEPYKQISQAGSVRGALSLIHI